MSPFAQRVAWTLVQFLWQGLLLWLLAWSVLALLKRQRAEVRYLVACGFLVICLALPVITLLRMGSAPPAMDPALVHTVSFRILKALHRALEPRLPLILVCWTAGTLVLSLRAIGGWILLHRLRASAAELLDDRWQACVDRLRQARGFHRAVSLLESERIRSPFAIGILKPAILVPLEFFASIDPLAAEAVLAHELAHIRRLDVLAIGLQTVIETLLFYHPCVWWISRRVRTEREHCCDDEAVQACGDAVLFAQTLHRLDALREAPLTLAPGAGGGDLMERIKRLLKIDPGPLRITAPSLSILLALSLGATTLVARQEPVRLALQRLVYISESVLHRARTEASGAMKGMDRMAPDPAPSVPTALAAQPVLELPRREDAGTGIVASSASEDMALMPLASSEPIQGLAPEGPPPEVTRLMNSVLDGQAKEFSDWRFTQGSCSYVLSGKAAPLRAGNISCGIYFKGEGRFHYVCSGPKTVQIIRPGYSADGMTCEDSMNEAIFWFSGQQVPEIPGTATVLNPNDFMARFKDFRERDQSGFLLDMALRHMGSTDKPYFRAQMMKGWPRKDWIHTMDAQDAETLSIPGGRWSEPPPFVHPWELIFKQPLGWTYKTPRSPRFVLTHVDVDLEASRGTRARLDVRETYLPLLEGLKALDLDLYGFRVGLALGKQIYRKQEVHLKSVRDELGRPLPFQQLDHRLLVAVPRMRTQVPLVLRFEIEGELLPENRKGLDYWNLEPGSWLPLPAELSGRAFTVHAQVKVPVPYVPYMGGETLARRETGGQNLLETRLDHPVQSFGITAGKGEFREETFHGVTLRVAGYNAHPNPIRIHRLKQAEACIASFERMLGPFPFKELNLIGWDSGMVSPGMIGMERRVPEWMEFGIQGAQVPSLDTGPSAPLMSGAARMDPYKTFFGLFLSREIAKQYWGQAVQVWSPEDQWIPSAFSEFVSLRSLPPDLEARFRGRYDPAVEWFFAAYQRENKLPAPLAYRMMPNTDDLGYERFSIGLRSGGKATRLLDLIHQDLGDAEFLKFLRTFYQTFAWRRCFAGNLLKTLQATSGKDYTAFLDEYLWGPGWPEKAVGVPVAQAPKP